LIRSWPACGREFEGEEEEEEECMKERRKKGRRKERGIE